MALAVAALSGCMAETTGSAEPQVRRVAGDRVQAGFAVTLDGQSTSQFATRDTIRVAAASKDDAVRAALAFCGRPAPTEADLAAWGDEPVSRAEDTGEWQFTGLC